MVDNAYPLHTLDSRFIEPVNFYEMLVDAGHPDRAVFFSSTSKITFAAGGVSCIAMSDANMMIILLI